MEAVHDWADFGDLPARQLQACIMIRHMTGIKVKTENVYKKNLLSYFTENDGLLYRPETKYSSHRSYLLEQALTLFALNTLYMDTKSVKIANLIKQMINTLIKMSKEENGMAWFKSDTYTKEVWSLVSDTGVIYGIFLIRPIVNAGKILKYKPALKFAGKLIKAIFEKSGIYHDDGRFEGHVHSLEFTLTGALDYAVLTKNKQLIDKINKCYQFIRSESTRFGFVPELTGRKDDVIGCETCNLMDYIDLAIMLARNGYPEYWADVERAGRNHLVESQVTDTSWMKIDSSAKKDDEFITYEQIDKRMVGGYAGWSSPNHILAYDEELHKSWVKDESIAPMYIGKIRAFQNCCGGSGTRAFYEVWNNITTFTKGTLSVNMHIDKTVPQAIITSDQPYQGKLVVQRKTSCKLQIRVPEFVKVKDIKFIVNGKRQVIKLNGVYAMLDKLNKGTKIVMEYPLPETKETIEIGNAGYKKYGYEIYWKGDTVIKVVPLSKETVGFSGLMQRDTKLYYGETGPGKLYQRTKYLAKVEPKHEKLLTDKNKVSIF
jgi:hypothetical protein